MLPLLQSRQQLFAPPALQVMQVRYRLLPMDLKKQYILDELWILAWNASVQRSSLYKSGASEDSRSKINSFKEKIKVFLTDEIIPSYNDVIDEEKHLANLSKLIRFANDIERGILGQKGYKYGVAQKLLNLYLKYHWCIGEIKEPPHCPIDRIVISQTEFKGRINWTQISNQNEYMMVIDAIRDLSSDQGVSIAQWELQNYKRR